MANTYFQFKRFLVLQDQCTMKVTTDACFFGAYVSEELRKTNTKGSLLDIGTGTGLCSLMIAQKNSELLIDAIEISMPDAKQATENIEASAFGKSINVIHANAVDHNYRKKYDIVISNPPFYETDLSSPDRRINTARHNAGLNTDDLVSVIKKTLKPGGHVFLLLSYKREKEICLKMETNGLYIQKKLHLRQTNTHPVFRTVIHAKNQVVPHDIITEEIFIKDETGNYSAAFTSLLQEYYLHL